ncbi:arsenate reductase [Janibacter melonis]|uniref:Arsenate reductase n=1 Tax=Janibacter melonis TaxID=262209 RepID=A0A176QFZ7_9MICO|nr:arsenate reductase (glutaredoxin) [Janibacter melonis]OAB88735.1 arsenate reductase [Janibacter melonis]
MAEITLLHNPRCSTSRHAVEVAEAAGADVEVVQYLKDPLDETALRELAGKLEDPVTDLVRRDSYFKELGLGEDDVASEDQVVAVLVEHPRLLQRPVLVRGDRAIIGRPKDRVQSFLG